MPPNCRRSTHFELSRVALLLEVHQTETFGRMSRCGVLLTKVTDRLIIRIEVKVECRILGLDDKMADSSGQNQFRDERE